MDLLSGVVRFRIAAALLAASSAVAVSAQTVTLSPPTLAFGNQAVNTPSLSRQVTLKNGSSAPLSIVSITSSLADFAETNTCPASPATLRAGGSCLILVTFTPAVLGTRSGTLTVVDSASNSPQTASMKGSGIAAVSLTPAALNFGNQPIGTSSAASTVTLKNNLSTALTISNIATTLSDFTDTTTCPLAPSTLAAGASCTVSVIFKPSVLGTRNATLIVTDSAGSSPQSVNLSGKGGAAVLVSIAVSPSSASVPLGSQQQFSATGTLSNGTTESLTSTATWQSSLTTVATISSTGLATSTGQGSTTITAVSGAISGSATLQITPAIPVSLAVAPASASIPSGTNLQFTATGNYGDGSTQDLTASVVWNSSSANVATVSSGGLASATSQGTTTITASLGALNSSATLTVGQPALLALSVTPSNSSFAPGTTQALKATGTYSDGSTVDLTGSAVWSSASPGVATVDGNGVLTAIATGSAIVTAAVGSTTGSTTAAVTAATLVSIAVTPAIPVIPAGITQQFLATGTFSDGTNQIINDTVQWNSDNTGVAEISNQAGSQGVLTSAASGTANISATAGSVTGFTVLTVSSATLVSIAVSPSTASVATGTSAQLTARGTYSDGSQQDLTSIASWSSSVPSTASVNNGGLVNGLGTGTTTIEAMSGSATGSSAVSVTPATLVSVAVSPSAASVTAGTTQLFTATGTFSDGTSQDVTQSAYWSSSAGTVATISDTPGLQGVATSLSGGTSTIRAVSGSVSGMAVLTVNSSSLVSIAVTPASASIALGASQNLTATGTFSDGSTQDLTGLVAWSSASAAVAIVSNAPGTAGLVSSSGDGTTVVSATLGSISGSASITVGQTVLSSILIAPTNVTIALGATQQFTATGIFSDGSTQDLTTSVIWASDATAVASISPNGLASGIGVGGAVISATSGSVTSSTPITVAASVLVSLSVSPQAASIPVLNSQQFSATGMYNDGSMQDLTNAVNWSSSDQSIATIGGTGLASSGKAGSATITASLGSMSAGGSLSVGTGSLSQVKGIGCPSGFVSGSVCTQATVSCPNTADMTVTWGMKPGLGTNAGAGTVIIFNGAAGVIAGGREYVTAFTGAGFTTVQVAWNVAWQDTGLAAKNILTAACRPAAVGQYLHDTVYTTGGFGVLGGSAGAGAAAYWLAWYNGGNLLDNAELASGPPYSDIEQGCEVPDVPAVTIIPTDGAPWTDAMNYRGGPQNGITTESGYTCRPSKGTTSAEANAAWFSQSIIQPGWTSSYPDTSVSGWVCNNAINNSESEGWLFFSQLITPYSLTAISGCLSSETVDNGTTPEGILGSTAISNDMITKTVKRHSP